MAYMKTVLQLTLKRSSHLLISERNTINQGICPVIKRYLLSSSYACLDAWEQRLQNPLLQKINMDEYFVEVERRFNTKKKPSGVDIDLFANNVNNKEHLNELEHLLYRFRKTRKTYTMLDSTHHAVILAFLKFGQYERLLSILNDRVSYGIFPNYYCYNILMDSFLKQDNNRDAAKIAVLMMLQEDFGNSISQKLSLYSCHMHLREPKPEPWVLKLQSEEQEEEEEKKDDDDEEVFVRVPYIRNPFFDDHFDLQDPRHLLGKTLYMVGRENNDLVSRTYQTVGLAMYEKWEKVSELLDKFLSSNEKPVILEEGIQKLMMYIKDIPDDESKTRESTLKTVQPKLEKLQSNGYVSDEDLHKLVLEKVNGVTQDEERDIKDQIQLFAKFEEERKITLDKQINEYLIEERLKAIEAKKKELAEKEELLFFFENLDKHEMELKKVEKLKEELQDKNKKKAGTDSEEYIPPDVHQRKFT